MKIRLVGAELSHVGGGGGDGTTEVVNDGRTDMTMLTIALLNSANEPKNLRYIFRVFFFAFQMQTTFFASITRKDAEGNSGAVLIGMERMYLSNTNLFVGRGM